MKKFISYKILKPLSIVLTNYEGNINGTEYLNAVSTWRADPLYHSGMNIIIDFRDCSILDLLQKLSDHTRYIMENARLENPIKVAILVNDPNLDLLMRNYQPIAKMVNLNVEPFFDVNNCFNFLGLNAIQKEEVLSGLLSIKQAIENINN